MSPIDLIPRIALYAAILGLTVLYAGQSWRLHLRTGQLAELRAVVAGERQRAAEGAALASENARHESKRRTAAQTGVVHAAENQSRTARVGAAAARVAGDGLRIRVAALAATCDPASRDPATAESGPPTGNAGMVLAGLLDGAVTEAIRIAAIADERGIAGQACVNAYDALEPITAPAQQ